MNTKVLVAPLVLLALAGLCLSCAPQRINHYSGTIVQPANPPENRLFYGDADIRITFYPKNSEVGFTLQNRTTAGAVLKWNEVMYISPDERALKTIHKGIRYADRHMWQYDWVIPPGTTVTNFIVPSDFFGTNDISPGNFIDPSQIGKEIGIFMPIELHGKKREYYFKLLIDSGSANPIVSENEMREMVRINTSQPSYHLLVLDRFKSPPNSDIGDPEDIAVLYKYRHGADGFLVAIYKSSIEGPVSPVLPSDSRVVVNMASVNPKILQDYIKSDTFKKYVSNRNVLEEMLKVF